MKKVLIIVITDKHVMPRCYNSLLEQDYPNFLVSVVAKRPVFQHSDTTKLKYLNCVDNRNEARRMFLGSDSDYCLFVDSDIVLPKNALSLLMSHGKDVMGGWYQEINSDRWIAGRWIADNTFFNFRQIQPSVVKTDVVGMGCALVSRKVLEQVSFKPAIDVILKDESGVSLILGECGAFGNDVAEMGFNLYMDGSVVCEHLIRN